MFMLKSTHEALIAKAREEEADTVRDLEAKFKKAVKDIAGLTEDVAQAEKVADARARKIAELNAEIAALKPDAEAMRAKRKRDRDLKAEKAKAAPKAASKKAVRK